MKKSVLLSGIVCSMLFIGCGGDVSDTKKSETSPNKEVSVKQETKQEKGFFDSFKKDYTKIELSKVQEYKTEDGERIKKAFINNTNALKLKMKNYELIYEPDYTNTTKKEVRDYALYILDHKPEMIGFDVKLNYRYDRRTETYEHEAQNKNGDYINEFRTSGLAYLLYDNDGDEELIKRIFSLGGWQLEKLYDILFFESNLLKLRNLAYKDEYMKITKLQKTRKVIGENFFDLIKINSKYDEKDYFIYSMMLNSFHQVVRDYRYSEDKLMEKMNSDNYLLILPYLDKKTMENNFTKIIDFMLKSKKQTKLSSVNLEEMYYEYFRIHYKGNITIQNGYENGSTFGFELLNNYLNNFYNASEKINSKELLEKYYDIQHVKKNCEYMAKYGQFMYKDRMFKTNFCEYIGITIPSKNK